MFKVTSSCTGRMFLSLSRDYNNFMCSSIKYQSYRWKRKPWWLPTAKSKMFRIPQHKKIPEAEERELRALWNHYRTEMKSIKLYMAEKLEMSMTGEEVIAEQARLEEEDHNNCFKLNEEWNEQVKKIREARITLEKEKDLEQVIKAIELKEKEDTERKERIEAIVREEKEKAKYYITSANIDAAIEEALTKEVDFNFAIDIECNRLEGRLTKPNQTELPQEPVKVAQTN